MPRLPRPVRRWSTDGAPPPLPQVLDAASEWWAERPPRQRRAAAAALAVVAIVRLLTPGAQGHVTVLVAQRDLPAGHVLGPADLDRRSWPEALAPSGAVDDSVGTTTGQRLGIPLPRGWPLTTQALAPPDPVDLAPDGFVALALDVDLLPDVAVGAALDLHGGDGTSVTGALLLGRQDAIAWLGVRRDQAGILSQALAWGPVHVAVVPQRRGPPTAAPADEAQEPAT